MGNAGDVRLNQEDNGSMLPTWGEVDQVAARLMAPIVGAKPHEVSVMGSLTANLHILMASFYRPIGERSKVILERDTFSSDYYAVQSQIQWHGLEMDNMVLIDLISDDTLALSTARILAITSEHASTTALIILSGVQYLTGQVLDMKQITSHAHSKGIMIGWDLAHAVGNVELHLHDWLVDFAVWCNYKYMNAGLGAIGSIFVHERHGEVDRTKRMEGYRPRLAGWWGNDVSTFAPSTGGAGYQLSNASVLDIVALTASLEVFNQTDMLEFLLGNIDRRPFKIITSSIPMERDCQLTLRFDDQHLLDRIMMRLKDKGFVVAQKEQMMQVAPVPLYNTFTEVWEFVDELRRALASCRSVA
ncbi:Kynureninase (L-kynurenine hydrolase) [Aspergillus tanneri]|uniref:Kynureninase (L-kynurenine hydrolase) n=1 Tax=Aspergillus tanneri TaxID=1220188 RepID=A0A5M9MP03_9EURO|nr:Kynureninase (L-kynurenine hydrolase) [Aspergillus tanneri]KAA8647040.1 Kynureninase (L-kynurenine hydrolase) [Aspergillus tanneri]